MQALIIWMLAIYGLAVVCIQCWKWLLRHPQTNSRINFFVYTRNSQSQIEWVLRSLIEMTRLEGREYVIYVIDDNSTDDTLMIIDRLVKSGHVIHLHDEKEAEELLERGSQKDEQQLMVDIRERCFSCAYRTG